MVNIYSRRSVLRMLATSVGGLIITSTAGCSTVLKQAISDQTSFARVAAKPINKDIFTSYSSQMAHLSGDLWKLLQSKDIANSENILVPSEIVLGMWGAREAVKTLSKSMDDQGITKALHKAIERELPNAKDSIQLRHGEILKENFKKRGLPAKILEKFTQPFPFPTSEQESFKKLIRGKGLSGWMRERVNELRLKKDRNPSNATTLERILFEPSPEGITHGVFYPPTGGGTGEPIVSNCNEVALGVCISVDIGLALLLLSGSIAICPLCSPGEAAILDIAVPTSISYICGGVSGCIV